MGGKHSKVSPFIRLPFHPSSISSQRASRSPREDMQGWKDSRCDGCPIFYKPFFTRSSSQSDFETITIVCYFFFHLVWIWSTVCWGDKSFLSLVLAKGFLSLLTLHFSTGSKVFRVRYRTLWNRKVFGSQLNRNSAVQMEPDSGRLWSPSTFLLPLLQTSANILFPT